MVASGLTPLPLVRNLPVPMGIVVLEPILGAALRSVAHRDIPTVEPMDAVMTGKSQCIMLALFNSNDNIGLKQLAALATICLQTNKTQ